MEKLAIGTATDGGCIKNLVNRGRQRGYVTIEELMECLSPEITNYDQVEDIVQMIKDMGIEVAR
jgi:RNA polymerase primary sigma factor